jgi:putative PIN family toxin of toxin-antitoxin system
LKRAATIVKPEEIALEICRDPDDLAILGTATAGQCNLLVTVDKDLLAIGAYHGVAIVKPGGFWRRSRS